MSYKDGTVKDIEPPVTFACFKHNCFKNAHVEIRGTFIVQSIMKAAHSMFVGGLTFHPLYFNQNRTQLCMKISEIEQCCSTDCSELARN